MINKLRNKFIVLSLSSILLVMIIIIGSINFLNYKTVVENSDGVLEMLVLNGGTFGGFDMPGGMAFNGNRPGGAFGGNGGGRDDDDRDDDDWDFDRRNFINSPETAFESRYFTVTFSCTDEDDLDELFDDDDDDDDDDDGSSVIRVVSIDINMIAAVDAQEAAEYGFKVLMSKSERGFMDSYRYVRTTNAKGNVMIIFLDCTKSMAGFWSFLYASVEVALLAFVVVSIIIIAISRRIVKPVAESYDKQKQFITDAGHEIRTPLTIIAADAAVIEMESGESEWIDDIKTQTDGLRDLTNDLVYLSRMEENQKQTKNFNVFSLSDLVSDTARSFESRSVVSGVTYSVNVTPGIEFKGDSEAIKKLLTILLDNAFKYTNESGTIRVDLDKIGKQIRLRVYNTADNISRDDLPHLFDRFYRSDKSRNSETGGHGIGLSIAQAIVTAHDGKITATSSDEKSLAMTVTLPL